MQMMELVKSNCGCTKAKELRDDQVVALRLFNPGTESVPPAQSQCSEI